MESVEKELTPAQITIFTKNQKELWPLLFLKLCTSQMVQISEPSMTAKAEEMLTVTAHC